MLHASSLFTFNHVLDIFSFIYRKRNWWFSPKLDPDYNPTIIIELFFQYTQLVASCSVSVPCPVNHMMHTRPAVIHVKVSHYLQMTKASISRHRTECAVIFYIIDRPTVIIGEKKKQSRLPVTQQRRSFLRFAYLTADSVASWQENSTRTRTRLLAPWIMERYDCFGFMVLIRYLTGIILMWESTKIITRQQPVQIGQQHFWNTRRY